MARFIVVHTPVTELTQDQIVDGIRAMVASLEPETEWISSWYAPEENKMFCEWEAPDEEAIRASIGEMLKLNPIETIYEVIAVDPHLFK
jgi:hypothetical protein